jgi:hypothetical protein
MMTMNPSSGSLGKRKDTDSSTGEKHDGDASELSDSSPRNSSSNDDSSQNSPHSSSNGSSTGRGIASMFQNSRDDRQISSAKCLFLFFLMAAAVGLGVTVYYTTTNDETEDFQVNVSVGKNAILKLKRPFKLSSQDIFMQFENAAAQVEEASNANVQKLFEVLETLSKTTTSFATEEHERNNGTYPLGFVTLVDAHFHLENAREESGAYVLAYSPIVQGVDYALWTEYVEENLGWLDDAWNVHVHEESEENAHNEVELQIWTVTNLDEDGNDIDYDPSVCYGSQAEDIADIQVHLEDPDDGPASPIWTISPSPKPGNAIRINYDVQTSKIYEIAISIVAKHREPTFHDICKLTSVCQV